MGQVEGGQVLVVEGGALAAVGVVRLEGFRRGRVLHDGVDPAPDLLHHLEVLVELVLRPLVGREAAVEALPLPEVLGAAGQVVVVGPHRGAQLRDPAEPGPPGPGPTRLLAPLLDLLGRGGLLVAHVDGGGGALEHVELTDHLGQLGDGLHGRGAGADDPDGLAVQRDVVVPARRVERVTLEALHTPDAGQFGGGEDAVGQDHVPGLHGVAPLGVDGPTAGVLVPLRLGHRRVEQAVVVELELLRHLLAVLEDLEPGGELHGGDVLHLFQQREVGVRLDVAGDAGIAVPVPRAADVAALLAEAHVVEPGLAELVPQQEAGEPGADHQDLALVGQGLPGHGGGGVDVLQVAGEVALHGHVVGGTPAGLLVLPVLGLLVGVEHRPRRRLGQRPEVVAGDHGVARSLEGRVGAGRPRVELLEAGGRVDADRRHGRAHFRVLGSAGRRKPTPCPPGSPWGPTLPDRPRSIPNARTLRAGRATPSPALRAGDPPLQPTHGNRAPSTNCVTFSTEFADFAPPVGG